MRTSSVIGVISGASMAVQYAQQRRKPIQFVQYTWRLMINLIEIEDFVVELEANIADDFRQ